MNIYRKIGTMIRCRRVSFINEIIDVENKIGVILTASLLKENNDFYLKFSVDSVVEKLMSENHSIRFKKLLALISEYKLIAQYRGLEFNQGFFDTNIFDYYKYYNVHQDLFKSEYKFGESSFKKLMHLCKMNIDLVAVYISLLNERHFRKNNRAVRVRIPKSIEDLNQNVTRSNSNQSELDLLTAYIAVNLYSDNNQHEASSSSNSSNSNSGYISSSYSSDSYSSSNSDSSC